ncbi:MAG: Ig-like domain-containing protein, partial [Christensenellaceae bacterium]
LSDAENVDYVRALETLEDKYGAKPALVMECEPVKEEGYCFIQGSVANILYENTNLEFTAAAFIKEQSENGEITYTYASYEEDVLSMGRSVFYVSEAALNDANANYSDGEKEILRGFIGRGIDHAAGLSEEESDSVSERELEIRWLKKLETALNIGETFSLFVETDVRYGEETGTEQWLSINVPVYWKSDNSSVIAVSRDGKVTALREGKANITACFGKITDVCEVVCATLPEYTCEIVDTTPYGVLEIENPVLNVREGVPFETKIRVKDYERCGELSFWINGEIYTTANGEITFSSTVSEDTVFEIKDVSSSFDYFSGSGAKPSFNATGKNLKKLILPAKTKNGIEVTETASNFFSSAALCKNLQEIVIPESYEKLPQTIFRNCSNLETIYLYNTNLANMSGNSQNWSGCTALQSIYVPSEALEEYKASDFWTASSACISKIPNEKEK